MLKFIARQHTASRQQKASLRATVTGKLCTSVRPLAAPKGNPSKREQEEADADRNNRDQAGEILEPTGRRVTAQHFEGAGLAKARIIQGALVLVFLTAHAAGKYHRVERKFLRAQVGIKKVDNEDEPDGQQSFLTVNQERDIENVAGHEAGKERPEPHHVAGGTDNRHSPEHRPIVELLPVGKVVEFGLRTHPKKPAQHLKKVLGVLGLRSHRVWPKKKAPVLLYNRPEEDVSNMVEEAG